MGRLSGISLPVGLLFIIWKFSVTVLFLFTPRRMTLTETALVRPGIVLSITMRLNQCVCSTNPTNSSCATVAASSHVIYLDFWNDGNGIYDRLVAELSGDITVLRWARLAADGRLKFGKVTALADSA